MRLLVAFIGGALLLVGGAVFLFKVYGQGLPIVPSGAGDLWQIELTIALSTPDGSESVRAALPLTRPWQVIVDERVSGRSASVSVRESEGQRVAVWQARLAGVERLSARYRIKRLPVQIEVPIGQVARTRNPAVLAYLDSDPLFPSDDAELQAALEAMRLPPPSRAPERLRVLYAFVRHEIGDEAGQSEDPRLVLRLREGTALGRERLLVSLLRAAEIPARLIRGLDLAGGRARESAWTEAHLAGVWVPLSAAHGFFATLPLPYIALTQDGSPLVEASGGESLAWSHRAIRERLSEAEIAALSMPAHPFFSALSLYQLSVPVQSALRILLLLPLGGLIVSLLRNVVGLPSFGTFMPMLIALAMRETGLGAGLIMIGSVLAIGVAARIPLQALHLLLVPRLALLLALVILSIAGLALLGRGFETPNFYAAIVFPVVILTMLVERVSLRIAEEGLGSALQLAASSTLIAILLYPLFRSELVAHVMFSFPELVLVVMGLLVWTGGYAGYRISDLLRFRALARDPDPA